MTEKTTYIAFDGKEFEDENECEAYENKKVHTLYDKNLFVYDDEENKIDIYNEYSTYYDSKFIVCKTKEAFDYVNEILKQHGSGIDSYIIPDSFPASFIYDDWEEKWKDIKENIKTLQNEIDTLSKYITKE